MKLDFTVTGTFDFCFDEKRQQELIEDSKTYPGGLTALVLDNLEVALNEEMGLNHCSWKIDPYQFQMMMKTLLIKEREQNVD